jgi:head-tail adaptor
MKPITLQDLREHLTLLVHQKTDDGEGGWREEWKKGPTLWASLWPLIGSQEESPKTPVVPHYRIVIRSGVNLGSKIGFLWPLRQGVKRLLVTHTPVLIQNNKFLCMTAVEEIHA